MLADTNAEPSLPYELDARVERAFGRDDAALLDGVTEIVLSPGVPMTIPLLQRSAPRAAFRSSARSSSRTAICKGTVIAITGSNGKSTTTALIGEILQASPDASRSWPATSASRSSPRSTAERPRTYVLELSSFQLETVDTFHANVALLLNITPDHMDRYADLRRLRRGEVPHLPQPGVGRHRHRQRESTAATTPRDSTRRACGASPRRSASSDGAWLDGDEMVMNVGGDERRIPRASLKLQGQANVENALAAWLAARAVGVDDMDVQIAFGTFAGLPHRMVLVRELDGVRWINDSKGTNVDATLKSLEGFDGGQRDPHPRRQGQGRRVRADARPRRSESAHGADHRHQPRTASPKRWKARRRSSPRATCSSAVEWARANAKTGETVLLSPACASFDQYRNFEHRGEHFEELVRAL